MVVESLLAVGIKIQIDMYITRLNFLKKTHHFQKSAIPVFLLYHIPHMCYCNFRVYLTENAPIDIIYKQKDYLIIANK